jgi:hypothetical protein
MRTFVWLFASCFVACAAPPRTVTRTPIVPLARDTGVAVLPPVEGRRAEADRSPPAAPTVESGVEPAGDLPAVVTWRTVTEIVEVPAPAQEPQRAANDDAYATGEYAPHWQPRRSRERWLPTGTVIGLGIGAAIGHHHGWHHRGWHHGGHRWRGAWLGGSLGFMWDLHRLWR